MRVLDLLFHLNVLLKDPIYHNLYCRVARTHSRYCKLTSSIKHSSVSAIRIISIFIDDQLSIQISIQIPSNSNPTKTYPNSLQTFNTHLFCSLHFLVMSLYASQLSYFPYIFWPLIPYCYIQSSWNLYHVKALFSPNSTRGHSMVPINLAKVEKPDFRFSPPCWSYPPETFTILKPS